MFYNLIIYKMSIQESYKIQAVHLQYEIYSFVERLKDIKLRSEYEERNVENVNHEVTNLRKRISDLKTVTFALAKGCPISSIDVRPQKTSRSSSSSSDLTDMLSLPGLDTPDASWLARQQASQLLE